MNEDKMQKLGEIWSDWNQSKLSANKAMYQIGNLFHDEVLKVWRERMKSRLKQIKQKKKTKP